MANIHHEKNFALGGCTFPRWGEADGLYWLHVYAICFETRACIFATYVLEASVKFIVEV